MTDYNTYPAVDGDYNFPPVIRQALASSPEVSTSVDVKVTQRISPTVERVAAEYVASNPAIRDAATAAIDTEIYAQDLIKGDDYRAAFELEADTGWAHAFTDSNGTIVAGIDNRGFFRVSQPIDIPERESSRTEVACIGDSLIWGYQTNGTNVTWPSILSETFPGVNFINAGKSGSAVDEVRFLIGALPIYAEVVGGVIPESGPVSVIVKQKLGFRPGRGTYYGQLAGVTGNIIKADTDGPWTFERSYAGSSVVARGKQRLVREDFYLDQTALFWMGRNDVSNKVKGIEGDVVKHVVASIKASVEHFRPREKQFGIASIVNMAAERRGSENHSLIVEINRQLAEMYPSNFIDIRSWLVNQAIYDAGLTPTAADLKAMSEDAPPPQIMDNGSHPLIFMVPHIAKKFENFLNEKGYI